MSYGSCRWGCQGRYRSSMGWWTITSTEPWCHLPWPLGTFEVDILVPGVTMKLARVPYRGYMTILAIMAWLCFVALIPSSPLTPSNPGPLGTRVAAVVVGRVALKVVPTLSIWVIWCAMWMKTRRWLVLRILVVSINWIFWLYIPGYEHYPL